MTKTKNWWVRAGATGVACASMTLAIISLVNGATPVAVYAAAVGFGSLVAVTIWWSVQSSMNKRLLHAAHAAMRAATGHSYLLDGTAEAVDGSQTALRILTNPRRLQQAPAWEDGLFDMQDASSQIAIERLPIIDGAKVLDYCAGGGGKSLGMADRGAVVAAHDGDPARMKDIAPRAKRAGIRIQVLKTLRADVQFDGVLCDAPCSGSGTWRRTPDAKWKFTPARLQALNDVQLSILNTTQKHVEQDGWLAYATCSILPAENRQIVDQFISQNPEWQVCDELVRTPTNDGDGFYQCIMRKN